MDNERLDLLFRKIRQGQEEAFSEMYVKTRKGIFSFLYTYIKDYHMCEDVLQDVYIKVRKNIDKYKIGTNPTAWLFQIAKNEALNYIQKNKRQEYVDFSEKENIEDTSAQDSVQYNSILETIIKNLDEKESRIVILHLVDGYKHKEIAQIVDEPQGTVLWRYNKAIEKLKVLLGEYR